MQFRREAAAAASDGGASASSSSPSSYYIVWSVCRHLPHLFGIFRKLLAGWLAGSATSWCYEPNRVLLYSSAAPATVR